MDWMIILFVIGLFLILLEITVIPGTTVFGVLGSLSLLGSFYFFLGTGIYALSHLIYFGVGLSVIAFLLFLFLPSSRIWCKFTLDHSSINSKVDFLHLLNREGYTLTPLHPAGTADFSGERVSVVSEGLYIGPDQKVKVIQVDGSRIVVRQVGNIE